jgi:hypothetical protein
MQPEIVAALIGVGGVVFGSLISYQLGKRQSVDQDLRARRIETTTTVRSKIHEMNASMETILMMHQAGYYEQRDSAYVKISHEVDDLADYYRSNKPWLPEEVRPIVEACIGAVHHLRGAIGPTSMAKWEEERMRPIAGELHARLDDLDRHVSRILGTLRPYWPGIFRR